MQQTINLGTIADDGTGDTLRAGGDKINDNFDELYAFDLATPELIRDTMGTALTAGAGITVTPSDVGETITVASTITQYTDEMARDALGTALVAGSGITITPNDGADTITIAASGSGYTDEQVRDVVGAALVAGTNVTITVNDGTDTITIDSSGGGSYTSENARDDIAAALVAGSGITITPNDGADTITIARSSPAIQSVTSSATVTPTFADDQVNITAQAAGLTLANPTGTAVDGWGIAIRIKDNGTARSIGYGTQYRAIGVTLPTTTVINKTLYLGMVFNNADTKWDVVAVAQEA